MPEIGAERKVVKDVVLQIAPIRWKMLNLIDKRGATDEKDILLIEELVHFCLRLSKSAAVEEFTDFRHYLTPSLAVAPG